MKISPFYSRSSLRSKQIRSNVYPITHYNLELKKNLIFDQNKQLKAYENGKEVIEKYRKMNLASGTADITVTQASFNEMLQILEELYLYTNFEYATNMFFIPFMPNILLR